MLPSLSQLPIGAHEGGDTDSDSSSSSSDDSDSDVDETPVVGALHRSYLKFTVSQDSQNQSFLTPSQFAKLDLYQIDALRDDTDPLALNREMQGATRHFPCHVFWSRDLGARGYAVWGRPTATQHEQEAVLAMLDAQREEREEYVRLKEERRWKLATERKVQEFKMAQSESLAMARSNARIQREARASAAPEDPAPNRSQTRRIASIVHRIVRREGSEAITASEAQTLINRGLKRLGMKALALGSFALVSAVAYMQLLQAEQAEQPQEAYEPTVIDGIGILQSPDLAASAED